VYLTTSRYYLRRRIKMANSIFDLSQGLADVVAASSPAVVRVEGRRRMGATGIVWSDDGVIMTANHVVRYDENVTVGLSEGNSVQATLIGRDPTTDLALLQVSASGLAPLVHADEAAMSVGHFVLALGRPGRTVQATLGIVSAYSNEWRTSMGGHIDHYLQTDVIMYPGFSGGPLVGADGRLLGLNTSALGQGVSLAIPTVTLGRVAEALRTHGRVRRGYLGVSTQRVRLPEAVAESLNQKRGLLVVSVEADSPAAEGGLTLGDTIVGIGSKAIRNHDDLLGALNGDVVGQKEAVRIVRGGQVQELQVKIGERA
jgi:S1-C subfamily serine protease